MHILYDIPFPSTEREHETVEKRPVNLFLDIFSSKRYYFVKNKNR